MQNSEQKMHEECLLSSYASELLIAYIQDKDFGQQIDAIVNDMHVKAELHGEEIDVSPLRLQIALSKITREWLERYYQEME